MSFWRFRSSLSCPIVCNWCSIVVVRVMMDVALFMQLFRSLKELQLLELWIVEEEGNLK